MIDSFFMRNIYNWNLERWKTNRTFYCWNIVCIFPFQYQCAVKISFAVWNEVYLFKNSDSGYAISIFFSHSKAIRRFFARLYAPSYDVNHTTEGQMRIGRRRRIFKFSCPFLRYISNREYYVPNRSFVSAMELRQFDPLMTHLYLYRWKNYRRTVYLYSSQFRAVRKKNALLKSKKRRKNI